jgi:hypothetical protein
LQPTEEGFWIASAFPQRIKVYSGAKRRLALQNEGLLNKLKQSTRAAWKRLPVARIGERTPSAEIEFGKPDGKTSIVWFGNLQTLSS